MAEKTIGRVSVKVTPDTSKFREEAKAKLEAEEKRLPKLDVELNIRIAEGAVAQVIAQAQAVQRSAQASLSDLELHITVDDTASVQAAVARIGAEIAQLGEVRIPVALDDASLAAMRAALAASMADADVEVRVDLDRASLAAATAQINAALSNVQAVNVQVALNQAALAAARARLQTQLANVPVSLSPSVNSAAAARAAAQLGLLARNRTSVITPVLNKAAVASFSFVSVLSGFDALKTSIDEARQAFLGLFTNMPQIMAIVPGVLMLTGAFFSMSANLVGLVGSLAQALPMLLALPGIAIGVGTMVAAFKDFATVLPEVVGQFKTLQPMISAAFWEQAKGPISELANAIFPSLQSGLEGTATALGGFFGSLSGAIQAALAGGALDAWFANLNSSIQIFTGFAEPLAQIFKIFGDIGSGILPLLAQYAGELAVRFQEFMQSLVAGAGGLDGFVSQTMAAFRGIIEFVLSIGNVFGAVFASASAAGAATFQSLADHLNTFAAFLSRPDIASGMTNLFGAAFQMFDNFFALAGPALEAFMVGFGGVLTSVLPQVGTVLGQVAEAFGQIFNNEAAMTGLTSFVQGILQGVQAVLPALAPLGNLIAALGPTLGVLAAQIGAVFGSLAPSFTGIVTALTPVIQMLSTGLIAIITALGPAIQQLGDAIAAALADPAFGAAIAAVVQAIIALVPALTPIISLAAQLVAALMPLVVAILTPLAGLFSALIPILTPIVDVIMQVVNAVAPLIPLLLDLVMSILEPLLPIVAQLAGALLPILAVAFQVLTPIITILIAIIQKVIDIIVPILMPAIQFLADILTGVLGVAFDTLAAIIDSAWQFIMQIWNAFKLLFSGDFEGFWNGIVSAFTGFMDRGREIFNSAWTRIKEVFSNAWNAIVNTARDRIDGVIQFFRELPDKVVAILTGLRDKLLQAGRDVIQGFIDGLRSMAGRVISAIQSTITNALPSFVKDALGIHSPSRVFRAFGQSLMQGLALGIRDQAGMVMRALGGVLADVQGAQFSAPVGSLGVGAGSFTGGGQASGNTLIYNAAPGSSFGAEEDLFGAIGRARAFGW